MITMNELQMAVDCQKLSSRVQTLKNCQGVKTNIIFQLIIKLASHPNGW